MTEHDKESVSVPRDLVWMVRRLIEWFEEKKFGKVTVSFQNGKPGHLEESNVTKAPEKGR